MSGLGHCIAVRSRLPGGLWAASVRRALPASDHLAGRIRRKDRGGSGLLERLD